MLELLKVPLVLFMMIVLFSLVELFDCLVERIENKNALEELKCEELEQKLKQQADRDELEQKLNSLETRIKQLEDKTNIVN